MKEFCDPQIPVKEALEYVGNNQAKLARLLGITKASVNEYVRKKREFLPELQAYRLRDIQKARSEKEI